MKPLKTEALNKKYIITPSELSDNNGGSSSYYDLPRSPVTGDFPKTLNEIIKWWDGGRGMSFSQGNRFKAAFRDYKKGISKDPIENKIYNLEKEIWFARDELDDLYAQDPTNPRSDNYGNGSKSD